MNKFTKLSAGLLFLGAMAFTTNHFVFSKFKKSTPTVEENLKQHPGYKDYLESLEDREERKKKKALAKGMKQYLFDMRVNQNTGRFDAADVLAVREEIFNRRTNNTRSSRGVNLNWEELGPDNVGGRCRAILIDKDNPLKMFAGGVSGGLFQSNNGGLSWEPHPFNKQPYYTGISAIKQAPNGDIYIATGEGFGFSYNGVTVPSFSAPTFIGSGVFKSTDGGQNFILLNSTKPNSNVNNDTWSITSELAIDPSNSNRVYAATFKGLKISSDGGTTWGDPSGLLPADFDREAQDVETSVSGVVHTVINRKYYRSTDGLQFFNMMGVNGFPSGANGRIEIAVSPTDANYVYALVAQGETTRGVYKSTDAGDSWELMIAGDPNTFDPLGGQGGWNNTIAVDPANKERIVLAGQLEVWSFSPQFGWNLIAFWQADIPSNPYYVHADNHEIIFSQSDPNNLYIGNDGGIFQTLNAQARFPRFLARNKGFNVTQFYGIGSSLDGKTLGGTQDNGTQYINLAQNTTKSAVQVKGGDGGKSEISSINPLAMFASIYGGQIERSSNGGASFGCFFDLRIDPDANCNTASGFFLPEYILWENLQDNSVTYPDDIVDNGNVRVVTKTKKTDKIEKSIIFFENGGRLWFTPDALNFSGEPRWFSIPVGSAVSTIEASEDGTIYYGTTSSQVFRVDGFLQKYKQDGTNVVTKRDTTVNGSDTVITVNIDTIIKNVPDYPANSTTANWSWTSTNTITYQGLTNKRIADSGDFGNNRYVTGIAIDQNNKERVIVTLGNYGNNNYVYYASDAFSNDNPTFTSLQNDLPKFPVYDAVIDFYNGNTFILGTDVGIWTSADAGATWTYSESEFTHVPVLELRQDKLYKDGCYVIYAGTHGRGMFRTFSPNHPGESVCTKQAGIVSSVNNINIVTEVSANFYPNPVKNNAYLEINVNKESSLNVTLIDLLGRTYDKVQLNQKIYKGSSKISLDFTSIPSGSYLLNIKAGDKSITKNVIVFK
jgi:hypothetical protein